ncbi:MAG TPA: hypothetical protein VLH16_02040 [Bacteroidales bacterium]|nr:hypothetical protein [Bacteroidales bacterium]
MLSGKRFTREAIGYSDLRTTLLGIDATLGVPGFPQSATGQASIFTGENAAALLGSHLSGFPDQTLRQLLSAKGMFKKIRKNGYRASFANTYRPPFFDLLRKGLPGNRYSCSTLIAYYGGLPFNGLNELKQGRALFMDITNEVLQRMGFDVPLITPEEGAQRLLKISKNYDFCMFEYFLTDLAGHLGDEAEASRVISILDRFVGTIANQVDTEDTLLLVTSDHGNLEDPSNRFHTLNQVPVLLVGPAELRHRLVSNMTDLTDLLPAIQSILEWHR